MHPFSLLLATTVRDISSTYHEGDVSIFSFGEICRQYVFRCYNRQYCLSSAYDLATQIALFYKHVFQPFSNMAKRIC